MGHIDKRKDGGLLRAGRRRRARLECRECGVVCQRVVSPWHCLKSKCTYVYAYADGETMYFGCLQKVFSAELDLAAFSDEGSDRVGAYDPYGPLRVVGVPRPQCRVMIERAYETPSPEEKCCNRTFLLDSGPQG